MPKDPWDVVSEDPAGWTDISTAGTKPPEPAAPQSSPWDIASGFARRGVDTAMGLGSLAYKAGEAVTSPRAAYELVSGLAQPYADQFQKAKSSFGKGDALGVLGHAAGMTPVVGPQVADLVERFPEDPYGVTGEAAFDAATLFLPKAIGRMNPEKIRASARGNYVKAMHPRGRLEVSLAEKGAVPFAQEGKVYPTLNAMSKGNEQALKDLGFREKEARAAYPTSEMELPVEPVFEELDKTARMRHTDPLTGIAAEGTHEADALAAARKHIGTVEEYSRQTGKKGGKMVVNKFDQPTRPDYFVDPNTGAELPATVLYDSLDHLKTTLQKQARREYAGGQGIPLTEEGPRRGAKTVADTLMGILDEQTPDVAAIHKQQAPRLDAQAVLEQAMERARGQDTSIAHGAVIGGSEGLMTRLARAVIYSKALSNTRQLLGSTGFRTLRGAAKAKLANAIENGDYGMAEALSLNMLTEMARGAKPKQGEKAAL